MYKEVHKWLKKLGMPVSIGYLQLRLQSHPDYPSLIAVQDTLGELGIISNAYQTDKENLLKASQAFLAHLNISEGRIFYFNNLKEAETRVRDFDTHWSGVTMLAEKTGNYGNTAHNKLVKEENQNRLFSIAVVALFLAAAFSIAIFRNSIASLLLFISNTIGLYFSWLIVQKEFGISNSISDKICSMAKQSRCESVLHSKGAKLFNWLSWGDIGVIYFSSSLLYLFIKLLTFQPLDFTFDYLLSLSGLFFPLYSLYYQWKVVKQWCMLCLAVLGALLFSATTNIIFNSNFIVFSNSVLYAALIFFVLTMIVFSIWQLLKILYQKSLVSLTNEIKTIKLKRNPEIFNALLQKQEINPINLPEKDEAIRFGQLTAPYQLIMACNPYCMPCAKAHQVIEQLYEKYPNQVAVNIRFGLFSIDKDNSVTKAVTLIVKSVIQKKDSVHEILKEWYKKMDYESFNKKYKTNDIIITNILDKYKTWTEKSKIHSTPIIYINGKKNPELYSWRDLATMIEYNIKSTEN